MGSAEQLETGVCHSEDSAVSGERGLDGTTVHRGDRENWHDSWEWRRGDRLQTPCLGRCHGLRHSLSQKGEREVEGQGGQLG